MSNGPTNTSRYQSALLHELQLLGDGPENFEKRMKILEMMGSIFKLRGPRRDAGKARKAKNIEASKARVQVNEGFRLAQERARKKAEEQS